MYTQKELEDFYENYYAESTPSYLWPEKVYNIMKWKRKASILDIGCWEGQQLEYFQKNGWSCTGTELNKRAAAVAASKGITVHQISIQDFFKKFKGRKWDVINIAYILEHIVSPRGFLLQIKKHLKKDGIIIVEVPNEFSPLQMAYIKKQRVEPYWIALPDHLNYFNQKELSGLMKNTGWKILHGHTSFPMELFLLMGDDYLKDKTIGKMSFAKVVKMESVLREHDPGSVSELYSSLYKIGVGRSIVIYATCEARN
jgi:2-polyprenyl-3-methyl-5-hydroxy-6-metoxy-1,4-benzoquinol methylase